MNLVDLAVRLWLAQFIVGTAFALLVFTMVIYLWWEGWL